MKVLLQRVQSAAVHVDGAAISEIGRGLLLLVGFAAGDGPGQLTALAEKILHLRIFPDQKGRFHLSVRDIGGEILLVPQFTLYADTEKGRRPDFFAALAAASAEPLFEEFIREFHRKGFERTAAGVFGAHMQVSLVNDGPVTIMLERENPSSAENARHTEEGKRKEKGKRME
jgi:D-tyrosyl-tRNA(Tyr) deacylase